MWGKTLALIFCFIYIEQASCGPQLHPLAVHRHLMSVSTFDGPYGLTAAMNLSRWRSDLFRTVMEYSQGQHSRWSHFNFLQPVITCPPGTNLERLGSPNPETDGGKWLCAPLGHLLPPGPCVVYSFGSRMDFMFEEAILNTTRCQVFTYDCTVRGSAVNPERHTFVKKCIGPSSMGPDFLTWDQALHANGHMDVQVLKIDIEGSEWAALGSWTVDTPGLPTIIAIELHLKKDPVWGKKEFTAADLALFAHHLGTLGYALVSREPNPNHPPCAEFTFLRVELPRRWSGQQQRQVHASPDRPSPQSSGGVGTSSSGSGVGATTMTGPQAAAGAGEAAAKHSAS